MIAHLRGTIHKFGIGEVMVDVQGVGYRVTVPLDVWEQLEEARNAALWIHTYIREDRFDLFGFPDREGQLLFEELIKMQGVGPKLGLELCAVPRSLLLQAAQEQDGGILKNVKGVGKRTAEKLVVELRALLERHPGIFGAASKNDLRSEYDQDAIAALTSLGYDSASAVDVLKHLPTELKSTEERVAAALRAL